MYRPQYLINKPSVEYNPLADGRQALVASTKTLRSHIPRQTESVQLQNHWQSLQHMPRIDDTSSVGLAAQGNLISVPKHPGFDYRQTTAPSNITSGMRGHQIETEGDMRTSSWSNETKLTSFALSDRSLDDVGLAAVDGSYRLAKASASDSRELLDTYFNNSRKPVSGIISSQIRNEWDPLDRIYMTKRRLAPTVVMPPIVKTYCKRVNEKMKPHIIYLEIDPTAAHKIVEVRLTTSNFLGSSINEEQD